MKTFKEDIPANNISSGSIANVGLEQNDTPKRKSWGKRLKKIKTNIKKDKIFRRY